MYAVIRKYNIIAGTVGELMQHVQEDLIPMISRMPGFRAYYVVEVGDHEVAAVTIFDTLAAAKAAAQRTAGWVAEYTPLFFEGFPETMAGPVGASSEPVGLSAASDEEKLQGCF